jgi:DNA-binding response OmpR family regulator
MSEYPSPLSDNEREELDAYRRMYADDANDSLDLQACEFLRVPFKGANRTARMVLLKLYRHNRVVRTTELTTWFFPDTDEPRAVRLILIYVCHLRKVFREKHGLSKDESITNAWGQGYMLTPRAREIVGGFLAFNLR